MNPHQQRKNIMYISFGVIILIVVLVLIFR